MKKNIKLNKGFTLVETLVAISIFTVSLIGIMSVLASGISNTNYAKRKIVASYLAQEGIEYIRNMRDTFVLYGDTFNEFKDKLTSSQCQTNNGCFFNNQIDYTNNFQPMKELTLTSCNGPGGLCTELKYDITTGKYGYAGTNSGYIRKIKIDLIGGGTNEIKVSSTVSWTQGSGTKTVTFSENLFNWVE